VSRLLLAASASVSIYKACDLASKLTQEGHTVRALLTANAARLISPQLFEAVTGEPAFTSEFDRTRRSAMDHIDLADWGDALLVAPASAGLVGRLAHGLADDLVTTTVLALGTDKPRFLCPAMNPNMLSSPPVARNLGQLREDGWRVLEPESGHVACGTTGKGRLPEPADIVAWLRRELA